MKRIDIMGAMLLAVFDLRGRLVCTLVDGVRPAGRHEVGWDGCDANGREMPSGVYVVRLAAPGGNDARRVTLAR